MSGLISKYRVAASVALVVLAIAFGLTKMRNDRPAGEASSARRTQPVSPGGLTAGETAYSLDVLIVADRSLTVNKDPNPSVSIPAGQGLRLVGWAIDSASNAVAGGISAEVDHEPVVPGAYGGDRPDVAAALKNDALKGSSFDIDVPAKDLPPGKHVISLHILKSDKSGYYVVKDKVRVTVE